MAFVKSFKSFIFTRMAFTSYIYLIFVPLVLLCFYLTIHRFRWIVLLVASYSFYMFYKPEFGLIILSSTFICWITSILIAGTANKQKRKFLLIIGIVGDAGILFTFKYYNFFLGLIQHLHSERTDVPFTAAAILLPVGISFYTFKSLGYLIDVYRNVTKPERHFGYFALYVSFFPQLIAGPIERANQLIPQLQSKAKLNYSDLQYGITRIVWGFFKKLVVADTVALFVNFTFGDIESAGGLQLYITLLFFCYPVICGF